MKGMRFIKSIAWRYGILAIAIGGLFAWWAIGVERDQLAAFDARVADSVQSLRSPALTSVMKAFTDAGSGLYVTGIALFLLFVLAVLGYRRELLFYSCAIGASALLNLLLKMLFRRTRPNIHRLIEVTGYSFPSGHSMSAFTLYGLTIYLLWQRMPRVRLRVVVILAGIVMILMIGISRIYLGVHYPSDVIGGYLVSAALLMATIGGYEHVRSRKRG